MNGSLTNSVARGATWVGLTQVLGHGLRFLSMIILARLLLPEDFGIVAMAAIVTSLISEIVDVGFNRAIVQRKEVTPSHLSTTFWVGWSLGIFFCIVTVAVSPFVANFFKNELVRPVLAVSALSFVISPLGAVHGALLRKRLDFFRFSVADAGAAVTYLAVVLPLAFAGFGIWSIVLGGLAASLAQVGLRWALCRWHPTFEFSFNSLKDLWGFGFNVTGIRLVDYLNKRLDYLIIGRFLTPAALGFYHLGLRTVNFPVDILMFVVTRVGFPAFSKIQDDDERLRRGFLKSVEFVSIIGLPLFVGLAVIAPEFVVVAFSDKWIPAILPMQILCIMAATTLVNVAVPSVILAKGRPNIYLRLTIARVALLAPCLLIGAQFGTVGVALSVAAVSTVFSLARQVFTNRLIGLRMKDYLASLRPAVLGSVVMTLFLLAFRYTVASLVTLPDIGLLIIFVLLGGLSYFLTLKIARAEALGEMIGLVSDMILPYARRAMVKIALSGKGKSPLMEKAKEKDIREEGGATHA